VEVYNGNVFVVRKVFDRAFIDKVIDQHDNSKLGTSYVYTGGSTNVSQADVKARLSMQCDIADDHHITQKVAEVVKQINSNHLHINVSKYCQENHFLKYPPTGHFRKHYDVVWGHGVADHEGRHIRKISTVCLLSDPKDFVGGKLAFFGEGRRMSFDFSAGDVVVFPSYVEHQVDSITAGVRYSTVHWSYGCF
jgi:predicted 2-oxoglutarate/Fe(II)-dependent dioxygenase YbiX